MTRSLDLTGQRFGRLVVQSLAEIRSSEAFVKDRNKVRTFRQKVWRCQCDCGRVSDVLQSLLRGQETVSCGCYRRTRGVTHGGSRTPDGKRPRLYRTWHGIKQRCFNPKNTRYKDWGGRGIIVCDEWRNDFARFAADMGEPPSAKHSIDRIDNDGPYSPSNCRWATNSQQQRNKRGFWVSPREGYYVSPSNKGQEP